MKKKYHIQTNLKSDFLYIGHKEETNDFLKYRHLNPIWKHFQLL